MLAGQRLVADDGYEVCLFPFEYLYMSQDEGGDYSHAGTYNIDLLGWGANGKVYQCPFYAPCTLRCVAIWDATNNNRVYQSAHKVHFADGTLNYLTICFAHDDNPPYSIGDTIQQGQLLGRTGTYGNVTGDHTHTCCGKGVYLGYTQRQPNGNYDLTNRCHYWDACYVNDTHIVQGYSHNWKTYSISPVPINTGNSNFNFILFGRNKKRYKFGKRTNI